jgi:uncharacterized protein (DUF697 family)
VTIGCCGGVELADPETDSPPAGRFSTVLLEHGIRGFGPLASADALATEYLGQAKFRDDDARVAALVSRETAKNFTTGFLTGLGGFLTLPVAVPAALAASWVVQARMVAAIARIYGHALDDERVRTRILLALAGDLAREAMRDLGLKVGDRLTQRAVEQIPGRLLVEVNKRIGAKLAAQVGQRVLLKVPRAVPVLGGVVGGALDAVVCRKVGATAIALFRPPAGEVLPGQVVQRSGTSVR